MKNVVITLLMSFVLLSCSEEDGKWDDIIKLSQKEVLLDAKKSTVKVTTEGEWWWFVGFTYNDEHIYFSDGKCWNEKGVVDDFIIEKGKEGVSVIRGENFTIERKNTTEIYITMLENKKDKENKLIISLEAGNYFDDISVVQKANKW